MQTDATCVTGISLAHRLPCTSGRVTTQRSAVVTRPYSGPKCAACRNFLNARPNAPGIMTSFAKHYLQHRERQRLMTCLYWPNAISFIRGHCVYSGKQGTIGSCNGASAQAAIHLPHRAVPRRSVHLRNQDSPQGCSIQQASACLKPRASCPAIASGHCLAMLIFHKPQDCPAYFKGGVSPHSKYARVRARWITRGYPSTEESTRCL